MRPPHPELAWPTSEPEAIDHVAHRFRDFASFLSVEADRWRPGATNWLGAAADAQHRSLGEVVAAGAHIPLQLSEAVSVIESLAETTREIRDEIRALARTLHAAEAACLDRRIDAERAARRAAAFTPGDDPASKAEAERLRFYAVQALTSAESVTREAEKIRRRCIAESNWLAASLERRGALAAAEIDSVLTRIPRSLVRGGARGLIADDSPQIDRTWVPRQIAKTTRAIRLHVDALSSAIARLEAVPWDRKTWSESMAIVRLTEERSLHQGLLAPGRQILEWDPRGDGRIVEVFGDLTTAQHIAVSVPGIMNTSRNFDNLHSVTSKNLWLAASEIDSDVAVIAWLGYDAPELFNAVSKARAIEYEQALRDFVDALPSDAHVSVVAHSYGTVLTGEAAVRGLAVDDLVLVGSPGTTLGEASDAVLEPGAQIWAAVSDTDWVVGRTGFGSVICPEKAIGAGWLAPLRRVANPISGPISWLTDSCKSDGDGDIKGLSHGVNPAHDDFGAVEISTEGVGGHSDYFDSGTPSLDAMAQIVTESHPEQR